ncbi:6292_t:CDS:1, partial [Ambispora gerdemannii]
DTALATLPHDIRSIIQPSQDFKKSIKKRIESKTSLNWAVRENSIYVTGE